jgi:hypothetical protein
MPNIRTHPTRHTMIEAQHGPIITKGSTSHFGGHKAQPTALRPDPGDLLAHSLAAHVIDSHH